MIQAGRTPVRAAATFGFFKAGSLMNDRMMTT